MKKFVSVLLSILLCLSFVACGGTDGDTTNSDIRGEFIGEWVNLYNDQTFTIEKKSDIKINENEIVIQNQTYNIETRNGITHIVWPENPEYYDYVKIEDAAYTTVDVTIDNWEEYFEIVPTPLVSRNSLGDIESIALYYCLDAKPETKSRLVRDSSLNQYTIGIEVSSDTRVTAFELDENDNIILKADKPTSDLSAIAYFKKDGLLTASDIKVHSFLETNKEFAIYLTEVTGGSALVNSNGIINNENIRVTRIVGKLDLYNKPLF